jgi:thioredoxin:protein disulfide reductase
VVLTGSQFGALNASPAFNLVIATAVPGHGIGNVRGLQCGFYPFPDCGRHRHRHGGGAPYFTALVFGVVAALLAGACVAPVVISVLVLATEWYQRGYELALLLPFVLGVGMALPWPLAGAGLAVLPKPGRWMNAVKVAFALVILGFGVYYGHLGVSLLRSAGRGTDAIMADDEFWLHSPLDAVALAKSSGKPLFIDFWATWCKNCLAMDATTFKDPAVMEALSGYVRLKYQAENPAAPDVRPVLEMLGVRGLPTYIVLQPGERQ